ncbi:MAG: hypothetical protein J6S85_10235 [Methanobrevibacter sp.]|nr:hypothetical protein [Methanobrevibacter sp.]
MKNNAVIYELIKESQGDLADRMHEAFDKGFEQGLKENSEEAYQKGLDDAWECADKLNRMTIDEVRRVFASDPLSLTIERESIFLCCTPNIAIAKITAYEEQKNKRCTACKYQNDTDGSECYECVKGMVDRYEPTESIKVGTRVRTTKNEDFESNEVFPIGTIGVIEEINTLRKLPYKISANGDYWFYSRDMFEVIDNDEILVGDEVVGKFGFRGVVVGIDLPSNKASILNVRHTVPQMYPLNDISRKTGRHFSQIAEVIKQLQEGE